MSDRELCEFSFDLYNRSKSGVLRKNEMKVVMHLICGNNINHHIDATLNIAFAKMSYQHQEYIRKQEYLYYVYEIPDLISPFYYLRDQMRKALLGIKFWKSLEAYAPRYEIVILLYSVIK